MKTLKRVLIGVLILAGVIIVSGFYLLHYIKTAAIPDYSKDIQIEGLSAEVNILRDSLGIPHIYTNNETDLYRAVGFAMAQDRLWQMDLLRRVTQGRLSEILGKDLVKTDILMRALRIQEKSEKILEKSTPEIIHALEAFSEGVNVYMANQPLPPEFKILGYTPEPWKPVHSVNLIGYMSWDLTSGWGTELLIHQLQGKVSENQIAQLIPKTEYQETAVFRDFNSSEIKIGETILSAGNQLEELGAQIFYGSNNWAVSGKKSKTGKPLLANDMHLGLLSPGIWYQMHQNIEGKLNVTGLVLPGQPFVIAGHNDSIAWGMTNVMVDDLDFYAEKLNEDSTKYLLDGEWKDLLIKTDFIKIKGEDDFENTMRFTHRGPIVNNFKKGADTPISIHWLGNEMSNEIRTVFLLNRASNWADFRDAVKTFTAVSQNIVYADVAGNIGLQCSAGVPIRAGNGIQIYPGDSSKYDWTGLVPFEELPFEFNPERGYVSSANNKTVPGNYPYYISHWFAQPDRIDRIREMLEEKELLGTEDFQAMHRDVKSKKAERFTPVFLTAINAESDLNQTETESLKILEDWKYELTRESVAASIFEIMYRKVCENLIKDDLSPEIYENLKGQRTLLENLLLNIQTEKSSEWIDDKTTPETETFDDIVARSFKETIADLTAEKGEKTDNWNWGKIHTFTIKHPLGKVEILDKVLDLNKGPFEVPGSYHTVCPYSYSYNDLYNVNHGASHRHIFDVSNWDASKTIIPTGTSGIPASDFYLNQTEMYINNQYHADPFSKTYVEEATKFKMKLIPR
ncbi:MAG TPA: penicillin acylase family protein [Draconibacterium sp.]|nr:penicillin acylase family protein [Draconibacterium sp.]